MTRGMCGYVAVYPRCFSPHQFSNFEAALLVENLPLLKTGEGLIADFLYAAGGFVSIVC